MQVLVTAGVDETWEPVANVEVEEAPEQTGALGVESDEFEYGLEGGMTALCHCASFHYVSFHYASFHCALLWDAEESHGTTAQHHEGSHEYVY